MNQSERRSDMARDINQAFNLADADFRIPRSDIATERVQDAYSVPLEDLHKLATAEMRLLVGHSNPSRGAKVHPIPPPHQGPGRVPPTRPALRGADTRRVPA